MQQFYHCHQSFCNFSLSFVKYYFWNGSHAIPMQRGLVFTKILLFLTIYIAKIMLCHYQQCYHCLFFKPLFFSFVRKYIKDAQRRKNPLLVKIHNNLNMQHIKPVLQFLKVVLQFIKKPVQFNCCKLVLFSLHAV